MSNLDVIIFMLPNGKIVADVTDELLQNNIKSILIDMSSSDPRDTKQLGKKLKIKDIKFLDEEITESKS